MSKFDKANVYTTLDAEDAAIGSEGYFADTLQELMEYVERDNKPHYGRIGKINPTQNTFRFNREGDAGAFALFYKVNKEVKSLNEIARTSFEDARKRQENGANISVDTGSMLKHCATEVVEATEAYQEWYLEYRYDKEKSFKELKDHFASELADIICCCTIIAGYADIDLDKAVADCLEKNHKRAEGIGDKL